MIIIEEYRGWKSKHPSFPLTVNPNGQWSKKVQGHVYYFGLLEDPDAALNLWLSEKDYLLAGQVPPTFNGGFTVGDLLDAHMADVNERVERNRPAKRILDGSGILGL